MSKMPIRAAALAGVLGVAAFAAPALGGDDTRTDSPTVRAAAATKPVVVGSVEGVGGPGHALERLTGTLAERAQAAKLEQYVAAVEAAKLEQYVAAVEAAKLEQYVAAVEAEEARRAEEARQAEAAAAPAPAAAPGSIQEIIQRHFGAAAPTAMRVAECESGMNPSAVSSTNDHGLFQINAVHAGEFEAVTGVSFSSGVYDPELNTIYARHLYAQQGWGPWTCA